MEQIRELTRAEEQIMQVLWKIGKGYVNDVIQHLPDPKPAYNTVSTIIRILEQKGFVDHLAHGRSHEYFPLIAKRDYSRAYFKHFVNNYFGSYRSLASFLTREEDLSLIELQEIREMVELEIHKKSKENE
ncbi:MAG: BlaI/MecI/CopY family transcriptional regulator [Bacteroidales bacterium]|nr:BlaI/MecI/CopY family transcriptional regulator [Bacteroidales bacterium]MDD3666944.1 BlaI/MecI/CopY family transcriptional regulator [Bacteroidales bacterium]